MKKLVLAAIAATMATMTTGANANTLDLQVGGSGPLKVTSTMMAIKSPDSNACPAQAMMKAWIYTNKAGPVSYMIIRHGQGAGAIKTANTKKVNGLYVAEISNTFPVHHTIDAQYRIAARAAGDYVMSNWAPLKANCA